MKKELVEALAELQNKIHWGLINVSNDRVAVAIERPLNQIINKLEKKDK